MRFYNFLQRNRLGNRGESYHQRFFTDPAFTVLMAGFVVFSFSVYTVAYNFGYDNSGTVNNTVELVGTSKVLGDAVEIDKERAFLDPDIYEYSMRVLLQKYLEARLKVIDNYNDGGVDEFINIAEQIQKSLLDMRVREYYRDVHLRIVTLIQKEIEYYKNIEQENSDVDKYSQEWEEILNQYKWLN